MPELIVEHTDPVIHIEVEVLRRILNCAASTLTRLKQVEGTTFPGVDQKALSKIREIQFKYKDLL